MSRGYTLIEMVIVIAVMGILSVVSFYGLGASRKNETLNNAQKELVTALRSDQNKVMSGVLIRGVPTAVVVYRFYNNQRYYNVDYYNSDGVLIASSRRTTNYSSNSNIVMRGIPVQTASYDGDTVVCLRSPNVTLPTLCTNSWGRCGNGVCTNSQDFLITDSTSSLNKKLTIEGSGLIVTRIYAQ